MKYFEERRTTTLRYTWYGAAVTKIFSLFDRRKNIKALLI
jgi:hypothetical protein